MVHLIWLLQEEGRDDLSPRNGTLIFNGVSMAGEYEYDYCLKGIVQQKLKILSFIHVIPNP